MIGDAQRVMLKTFTPVAAEVRESLRIPIVRLYSVVDLLVLGYAFAVIPTVIRTIVGFIGHDRRFGLAVLAFNQRLQRYSSQSHCRGAPNTNLAHERAAARIRRHVLFIVISFLALDGRGTFRTFLLILHGSVPFDFSVRNRPGRENWTA